MVTLGIVITALFNLVIWVIVALFLVVCAAGALFLALKFSDWIQAVRHARRLERVEAARAARKKAELRVMGAYANPYVTLRYNEFHLEDRT